MAAPQHAGNHDLAQTHDAGRHEICQGVELVAIRSSDGGGMGDPRVRNHYINFPTLHTKSLDTSRGGEIDDNHARFDSVRTASCRDACEFWLLSGGKHDIMAALRKVESELLTDTGRGARDERTWSGGLHASSLAHRTT